jgi:hypothetical protein
MKVSAVVFLLPGSAVSPGVALAYTDPTVGGWLFQLLFPVLVALWGFWLMFKSFPHPMVANELKDWMNLDARFTDCRGHRTVRRA